MSTATPEADFALTPDYDSLYAALPDTGLVKVCADLSTHLKRLGNLDLAFGLAPVFEPVPTIVEIESAIPELVWPTVAEIEAGLTPLFHGSLLEEPPTTAGTVDFSHLHELAADEPILIAAQASRDDRAANRVPLAMMAEVAAIEAETPVVALEAPQSTEDDTEDELAALAALDELLAVANGTAPKAKALEARGCTGHGDCEAFPHAEDCLATHLTDAERAGNVIPADDDLRQRADL